VAELSERMSEEMSDKMVEVGASISQSKRESASERDQVPSLYRPTGATYGGSGGKDPLISD
jgi:hypothetical protein